MINLESAGILSTLLMFFVSGAQKVRNPNFELPRFVDRIQRLFQIGISSEKAWYVLFFVGVAELLASSVIAIDVLADGKLSRISKMSLLSLAAFTVSATVLFYANSIVFQLRPFLSNLSTLGSILLAVSILKTRS